MNPTFKETIQLPPEPKGKTKFTLWENREPVGYLWADDLQSAANTLRRGIISDIPGNACLTGGLFLSWTGGAQ